MIESGQPIDVQRIALLQSLDIVEAGHVFASEMLQRQREYDRLSIARQQFADNALIGEVPGMPEIGV